MTKPTVLVLGGGVGAERDISIASADAVATALIESERFNVEHRVVGRLTPGELATLPGDVIAPILHGAWGEGGPMQDILVADGRPFVGSGPDAARLAMDKIAFKLFAQAQGAATKIAFVVDPEDEGRPLPLPVVVKPIRDGSTVGLHICTTQEQWLAAHRESREDPQPYMVEPLIEGREVTVGVVGGEALPIIEIVPADGLYDYDAKYTRQDTRYLAHPELPEALSDRLANEAVMLAHKANVRHLCRLDYIIDEASDAWLLELNTMPGFTDHSLVPMAARARRGDPMEMPELCRRLVEMALSESLQGARS